MTFWASREKCLSTASNGILLSEACLSCVISVEGVGEKNGGANANQERNNERHVNVPHSGWGKFREFLFQKRFAAPRKRFRRRPPGASAPRRVRNEPWIRFQPGP